MNHNGLYIHIPFCKSKCIYCDFYSIPSLTRINSVIDGLIYEYEIRSGELLSCPNTIYIGGGTPSVLPPSQLKTLLNALPIDKATEVTVEANPDDVTPEFISILAESGVNRLSLGIQSLDDDLLKWMRRRHDAGVALKAIEIARKGGITNISGDLIYGLPEMSQTQWINSVKTLIATGITHLSAYCLTYADNTPLMHLLDAGEITEVSDEVLDLQFSLLRDITREAGFEHYEISNFALPGFRSVHNSSYWNPEAKWLGIGPSAHSFNGNQRKANPDSIDLWLAQNGRPPKPEIESEIDLINDRVIAALRTSDGFCLDNVTPNIADKLLKAASKYLETGQMLYVNNHLRINPDYWLISNIFMRDMILE